jgi:hypothetical protein
LLSGVHAGIAGVLGPHRCTSIRAPIPCYPTSRD